MRFASLGSGSEGNALLISSKSGVVNTNVMLDCGFGIRETERRLARLNLTPGDLSGIIVTHEHQDHVGGVFKLARRYGIPVWLTYGTYQATLRHSEGVTCHICRDDQSLFIGDLHLLPYTVPHDAREPVQYVIDGGHGRLGVLTDAGHATQHMTQVLGKCDVLILECNHDRDMLANSTYPPSLRHRIGGPYGHLANDTAAQVLKSIDKTNLKLVIGAHLSRQNNTADLAREALAGALGDHRSEIMIACQDEGFDWINLC